MEQKKIILKYNKKKSPFRISAIFKQSFLKKGKKTKAEALWLNVLKKLKRKDQKKNPYTSIFKALLKISPLIDLRSLRRGRTTYQIPVPIRNKRRFALGVKWLIEESLKEKKSSFLEALVVKILEAEKGQGNLIEQKRTWHKTARSKMLYLRYRWF
jgi:small subunit ribosomal protein S7